MGAMVAQLGVVDLRRELPRAAWSIGTRYGPVRSITLHYNGPPIADRSHAGEIRQLQADARWHMGPYLNADGLQYHYAVTSGGVLLQCRDEAAVLWHCANRIGNETSLSIHLPLGGTQDATPEQWNALTVLLDALIVDHDLGGRGRAAVVGHREWPRSDGKGQSSCPGPVIMRRLAAWRNGAPAVRTFRTIVDSNVRQGPGRAFSIAWGGKLVVPACRLVHIDEIKAGEVIAGDARWCHMISGDGFIHMSCLEPAV